MSSRGPTEMVYITVNGLTQDSELEGDERNNAMNSPEGKELDALGQLETWLTATTLSDKLIDPNIVYFCNVL